jgi:iron-sulfur cluster repair protein YtfE (RIC family)
MDADLTRRALLVQHERIRELLGVCVRLAQQIRDGAAPRPELDARLDDLRHVLGEHNALETRVVRALLDHSQGWGDVLVDRMLEEHVAEHAAFWDALRGPLVDVVERIADLADDLDAHMAAEERTFLSPAVLHRDAIARRHPAR